MPIAMGSGRLDAFIRGASQYAPQAAAACGGSSSAERGSNSRLAALVCDETEEDDGEVQSSFRGPLETMDALQDALPRRREVPKLYNSKSSSLVNADDLLSPQPAKDLASPENPSPKKRKGLLPFSINQNELKSKILSPFRNVTDSSPYKNRKLFYPAVSSPYKSRSNDEHECKTLPCHCLEKRFGAMDIVASQPVVALQNPLISVDTRYVSTGGLQDVADSIDDVSPKEKRRKN